MTEVEIKQDSSILSTICNKCHFSPFETEPSRNLEEHLAAKLLAKCGRHNSSFCRRRWICMQKIRPFFLAGNMSATRHTSASRKLMDHRRRKAHRIPATSSPKRTSTAKSWRISRQWSQRSNFTYDSWLIGFQDFHPFVAGWKQQILQQRWRNFPPTSHGIVPCRGSNGRAPGPEDQVKK